MKPAPAAPRGPDPHTAIHRRVSRDEEWPRFACGAPAGRSGEGWPSEMPRCAACAAVPVEQPEEKKPRYICNGCIEACLGNPNAQHMKGCEHTPPAPSPVSIRITTEVIDATDADLRALAARRPRRTLPTGAL